MHTFDCHDFFLVWKLSYTHVSIEKLSLKAFLLHTFESRVFIYWRSFFSIGSLKALALTVFPHSVFGVALNL